ncbi:hypothetical protein HYPSUDRAFT_207689 [Hypholoma sublateritium FD-334 SS-4]|uniref:Uncharacterized protein n=1 Tax=Hypholoma sublateritium (strain FD-334 SS-4) TaxID=945553 RepID=A0A0D2P5K0_HYPSF|nr:hypothetical protein HYPSUDRAFT_207689 [Hypholoma sublateritium FD-334 SS-4]
MNSKCPTLNDSNRIFYHFLNRSSIKSLADTPIRIEDRSYHPHPAPFIQQLYGLKIAINGVSDGQSAKSMIDAYLQRRFGDASGEPVVRRSRVKLDGSVYCVVLSSHQIIQTFLREPSNLFENSGINTSPPPQYLHLLSLGSVPPPPSVIALLPPLTLIPPSNANWTISQCSARIWQQLSGQSLTNKKSFHITSKPPMKASLAPSTAVYAAFNLTTTAQFTLTSLQQSLTTLRLMPVRAHDEHFGQASRKVSTASSPKQLSHGEQKITSRRAPRPSIARSPGVAS